MKKRDEARKFFDGIDLIDEVLKEKKMRVSFSIKLFDAWIGFYFPPGERKFYFCPFPCCVFKVTLKERNYEQDNL